MQTIIELNADHPVVDAIANHIALVNSQPDPNSTCAHAARQIAVIAAAYAKQVSAQRDLMRTRLQTIYVYQKSVASGQPASLHESTIRFCEELGYTDWRERPMNELLSTSQQMLKTTKLEWIKAEVYRIIAKGELLTELSVADFMHLFAESVPKSDESSDFQ
jgi:hypothetical protein